MNFSGSVNGDLVAGANAETRVVSGAKVHDTFTRGRVGLLVQRAVDGEPIGDARWECAARTDVGGLDIHGGGLRAGGHIRSCGGGDAVLDVGAGDRVGVEGLDVEDDRDDVHVEPEARA